MRKIIDAGLPKDPYAVFGRRLDLVLKNDGITKKSFAKKIGVAQPMISGYITGKRRPGLAVVLKIQKELDVSLDWMFGLVDRHDGGN